MKKFLKGFFAVLACTLMLAGCAAEEPETGEIAQQTDLVSAETIEEEAVSEPEEEEELSQETEKEEEAQLPETLPEETVPVVPEESEAPAETVEMKAENAQEAPAYHYQELDQVMYASQQVNVRSLPLKDGERLGGLSYGEAVTVTGQCDETGWYRVKYQDGEAFVSNQYLVSEQPAEKTVKESTQSTEETASQAAAVADTGSGMMVWIPTKGGTKYHSHSSCSGMKGPEQVTLETALARGFTACKKCY